MSSSEVESSLNYFSPPADGSKPWVEITQNPGAKERAQNWEKIPHTLHVENIRRDLSDYTLDTAGFQLFTRPTKHAAFDNDEKVKEEYYPESIEAIKELTGASRVVLFDHSKQSWTRSFAVTKRKSAIRTHFEEETEDTADKRQPVPLVHVDQTTKAAENRVRRHLPPENVDALLKKRFQILNLWRPIAHPADDYPLAFCDFRSVDPVNDFVPTTLIYPQPPHGETMSVKFNPDHKWKYLKGMKPEEFVLIKWSDFIGYETRLFS
jgi:hypothetical protein